MAVRNPEYEKIKGLSFDLNSILYLTSDIIDTLSSYPEEVTTEDIRTLYRSLFLEYSVEYTRKRKQLIRKLDNYIEYSEGIGITFFLEAPVFKEDLESMEDIYPLALNNRKEYAKDLEIFKESAREAKRSLALHLNNLLGVGSVRDKRTKILKQIVTSSLDNPSLAKTILDKETTVEVKQEILIVKANKINKVIAANLSVMENTLRLGSLADLDVNSMSSNFRRLLKKLGQLNRNPILNTDGINNNVEDYWREKIRNKFGGDLPFCDEVDSNGSPIKVIDRNGVERYAKASEVIDLGGGKYVLKSDIDTDILRKSLRSDTYDTY